jgi:3-hydroxybutyryl-CoA dehydrogenase
MSQRALRRSDVATLVRVHHLGASRSFPDGIALQRLPSAHVHGVLEVVLGETGLVATEDYAGAAAILVELREECLGIHTGETLGTEGSNIVGFARFCLGQGPPSRLVEVVTQPNTAPAALALARLLFGELGLVVAVCHDVPGRIVNRLVRPFYNSVLRALDDGLGSAEMIDRTIELGLGHVKGPLGLLAASGLADHHVVTSQLYRALADPAFSSPRRSQVASVRAELAHDG